MSDERLRELDRRVQANPTDFALGHELVRALERAGERRRSIDELRRLLRAGDAEARRRLERRLPPRAHTHVRAPRDGLADPAAAREHRVVLPLGANGRIAGVTDDTIVVQDDQRLAGVDARTLAERWTLPRGATTRLPGVGADTLVARTGDSRLVVLDAHDGTRRKDIEIGSWFSFDLVVDDRDAFLLAAADDGPFLEALDLESGKILWKKAVDDRHFGLHPGGGTLALVSLGDYFDQTETVIEVRAAATGDVLWRKALPPEPTPDELVLADLLTITMTHEGRVVAFDRRTGERLGPGEGRGSVALVGRREVALADPGAEELRWRVPLERGEAVDALLAGRHVWLAQLGSRAEGGVVLTALDARTGVAIRRDRVALPGLLDESLVLVALDGAILLLAKVEGAHLVHRVSDA